MDNVPQLSQCFFQLLVDGKVLPHYQPILQVLETRELEGQDQGRARLSDSIFFYAGCVIVRPIYRRFESDLLTKNNGVIQVTDWTRSVIAGKVSFNVADYKVISVDSPISGNPQYHSGNPEEYRNKMSTFQQQMHEIQNPAYSQSQWRTPTNNEPENIFGDCTKPGHGSSPNDSRQPLSKRQPTNHMSNIVPIGFIEHYCNEECILPKDLGREVFQQQKRRSFIDTEARRPKRHGPLTTGLLQRIRTLRSAENFAKFHAFKHGTCDEEASQPEYPKSNRKVTAWAIDIIISTTDSTKAILRRHE